MELRDFDRVISFEYGDLFTLSNIVNVWLTGHCLVESLDLQLSGNWISRKVSDWGRGVWCLSVVWSALVWTVLLLPEKLSVIYAVFVCLSLEGTAVIELALLLKCCNRRPICFGSFYIWFVPFFLIIPRYLKTTGKFADNRLVNLFFFQQNWEFPHFIIEGKSLMDLPRSSFIHPINHQCCSLLKNKTGNDISHWQSLCY